MWNGYQVYDKSQLDTLKIIFNKEFSDKKSHNYKKG